jgi:two-component system, cell cycle sensor histidine kinase and response regulator CckA
MKQILVVDDYPIFLKFMSNLLKGEGHDVLTAEDGLSALDVLKTSTPDVVFTDLVMPKIDGQRLIRIIRGMPKMKNAYLVVLTAIAAEEPIDFTGMGADACISKGPSDRMDQNIIDVMDLLDKAGPKILPKQVIGLEDVRKREITRQLLSSRKHFELIFNRMKEAVIELSSEGKIFYANPSAISLCGIPEEELLGLRFPDLCDPAHRPMIEPLLATSGDFPRRMTLEFPLIIRGRQVLTNLLQIQENGHQSLVVILNTMSEKARVENQLRQAQKMEALSAMAGGIAHEFNNALANVSGNIELLQMDCAGNEGILEYTQSIQKSVERMANLTGQLVAYARGGKHQVSNISFLDFVRDTVSTFSKSILSSSIEVRMDLPKSPAYVNGDLAQLTMVLSAVLRNASEAVEGKGRIRVQVEAVNLKTPLIQAKPDMKPGRYVCLTVEDNGKGMDEQTRSKIFEPFYTTKFVGRGLGMAAAYGIIKNHGGSIFIQSQLEVGTQVEVYLPMVGAQTETRRPVADKVWLGTGAILIVEDEESVMGVIRAMLQNLGYQTLAAKSGSEAVEIARDLETKIDVVLLDIKLPDMTGSKLYGLLKKLRPDIKVMICSGYPLDGPAQEIMDAGAQAFIQKPFPISLLSQELRGILKEQALKGQ